ncbi:MAG: NADH-quinone oxidoreductase subunit C [Campylobacteraceae bacterium]|nr:NADH-quinone oxidoreductase subunit C [Campylobacteraceae bacterium]
MKQKRLIARFALENSDNFEVITVFDDEIQREILDKQKPLLKSITSKYTIATWFERKIKDDFGIKIEGAYDNRPLVHHERFPNIFPMQKEFVQKNIEFSDFKPYKYETVGGEGVFEVAVGPIHAGIIEPGHFQFSQEGERMLHLEVRHFYTYRGIEKSLEGKSLFEAKEMIERISGNESIAYQLAWFDILAEAGGLKYDEKLKKYHCLLLEIERIIHHLTDIGFIPNDAGFGAALSFASQLCEDTRVFLQELCGHRFGFGSIGFEVKKYDKQNILDFLNTLEKRVRWFEDWIIDIPSLWDRFDSTGVLSRQKAKKYCVTGIVARASGEKLDARNGEFYKKYGFVSQNELLGDVASRFKLRIKEIYMSISLIKSFIDDDVKIQKPIKFDDGEYISYVESSIGELFMFIKLKNGKIDRFYARDASFINWQALYLMMEKDIIADFPLINKSCDLSYAGNDL